MRAITGKAHARLIHCRRGDGSGRILGSLPLSPIPVIPQIEGSNSSQASKARMPSVSAAVRRNTVAGVTGKPRRLVSFSRPSGTGAMSKEPPISLGAMRSNGPVGHARWAAAYAQNHIHLRDPQ